MTHLVLGYPSLDAAFAIVETMVETGVDLIEFQVPFSEPLADGPVISHANHAALETGAGVDACLECAGRMASLFPIPFFIMTYYNLVFRRGVSRFTRDLAEKGLAGAIVPDLPPEEGSDYLHAMHDKGLAPILFFSPSTREERMREISAKGGGFIYCVAREGVTGAATTFAPSTAGYLARCRAATTLPIAMGFGIRSSKDIRFLTGNADIAVVGTSAIKALETGGLSGLRLLLRELRTIN
jgi:tryptophan synthase alpha chain